MASESVLLDVEVALLIPDQLTGLVTAVELEATEVVGEAASELTPDQFTGLVTAVELEATVVVGEATVMLTPDQLTGLVTAIELELELESSDDVDEATAVSTPDQLTGLVITVEVEAEEAVGEAAAVLTPDQLTGLVTTVVELESMLDDEGEVAAASVKLLDGVGVRKMDDSDALALPDAELELADDGTAPSTYWLVGVTHTVCVEVISTVTVVVAVMGRSRSSSSAASRAWWRGRGKRCADARGSARRRVGRIIMD